MRFPGVGIAFLTMATFVTPTCAQDEPVSVLIERGNEMLSLGKTGEALTIFTNAINKDTSNYLTYYKRATTYLAMSRHSAALSDFNKALQLKPDFYAAISQRGKVMLSLGQWNSAELDLKENRQSLEEIRKAKEAYKIATQAYDKRDGAKCIEQASTAISIASASSGLRLLRARCHILQGNAEEAIGDLIYGTRLNPSDPDIQMLSANLFFFALDDNERAIQQLKACLHYDPDAKACKKSFRTLRKLTKSIDAVVKAKDAKTWTSGKKALKGSDGQAGLLAQVAEEQGRLIQESILSKTLQYALMAKLDGLACEIFAETKDPNGMEKCNKALEFDPNSINAMKAKATILLREELFEDAIEILNKANEVSGGQDNSVREYLQKAQRLLKVSKQKDYYKVLDVSRDADTKTIKKKYRQLTKEFHPDKYHGSLTSEQVVKKIEGINEAYEVLANPELRQRFDNGDDPNAPPDQQHNPFSHHGGFPGGQQFYSHGFPGGNPFGGGGGGFKFQF